MIISVDHKGLEWVIAVYLSQDPIGMQEIWDGVDQHADNQKRFALPDRVTAKTFLFQLIYCKEDTAAWSFANNPSFNHVSKDTKWWQKVIDGYYSKYERLFVGWHGELRDIVGKTGKYEAVDGRVYNFEPYKKANGEWVLPLTRIYNYPVQGLGAGIVKLSRISLWNRLQRAKQEQEIQAKLINTVHDDIWIDLPNYELIGVDKDGNPCYNISITIENVFKDLPANFERAFKVPFNLPTRYEIKTLNGENI